MADDFFKAMERVAIQVVQEGMKDELNQRALDFFQGDPRVLIPFIKMRYTGKMAFDEDMLAFLLAVGVLSADKDGYFVSDVTERVVDKVLELNPDMKEKLEKNTGDPR